MPTGKPFRYNISNWHQLPKCKSNTSKQLKIDVSDFIQDDRLSGINIAVNHPDLGTLFAVTLNASGTLIEDLNSPKFEDLSVDRILLELKKYGFYVTFNKRANLLSDQLLYLMTLNNLGYAKIRTLHIPSSEARDPGRTEIVAFTITENPRWLNNEYKATEPEFLAALNSGSAISLSGISGSNKFDWTWLDYVANIEDILADNA